MENVQEVSTVKYAGFFRRFFAAFVDIFIIFITGILLITLLGVLGGILKIDLKPYKWLPMYIFAISYLIYHDCKFGQTPGKKMLGIKVVDSVSGQIPSFKSAFFREFLGKSIIDNIPILGTLDYLWVIWDKKKQAWHDKTIVVKI